MNVTLDAGCPPTPPMAASKTDEILPFDVFLAPGDVSCFGTNADASGLVLRREHRLVPGPFLLG